MCVCVCVCVCVFTGMLSGFREHYCSTEKVMISYLFWPLDLLDENQEGDDRHQGCEKKQEE